MNELISIIVPVYNAEKTLERCVKALIGQTYEKIEIILVNDGSKDTSLEICNRFAEEDARIIVVDKSNGGVSSARNAGLGLANGEFIMFCDSDDWAEPEWCEELISNYDENSLVMCGHYVEGEQSYVPYEIKSREGKSFYDRKDYFDLHLMGFNVPWNKIYSSKIISNNQLRFDCRINNGEDLLFNVKYMGCITGKIKFLDKCVFHYKWPAEGNLSVLIPDDYFEKCCILYKELKSATMEFSEVLPKKFYTTFYLRFEKALLSILNSKLSYKEKHLRMKRIMSSEEYRVSSENAFISTNKIYTMICRSTTPVWLMIWHSVKKMGV